MNTSFNGSSINKFIEKTYRLVNEQTLKEGPIRWSKSGKSFEVVDINKLAYLMPDYFNSDKYSSFVRQLNIYGFQIIKKKDRMTFRHPYFIRDVPEKMWQIKNKKAFSSLDHGFGSVLREIEQYKSSCKLIDAKLDDLREKRRKQDEKHEAELADRNKILKKAIGMVMGLCKLSTNDKQMRELFNDLKDEDHLFKNMHTCKEFPDVMKRVDPEDHDLGAAVDFMDDYITNNIPECEIVKLSPEKSFNLSYFETPVSRERLFDQKEKKVSGFELVRKRDKFGLSTEKTDHKRPEPAVEEDISFKLMEGIFDEPRKVDRILDFN